MRRIQFIELHDQPWFPASLRDATTDTLQFGLNFLDVYAPIAPLLQSALIAAKTGSIVDLCSGGGGPWPRLARTLQDRQARAKEPPLIHVTLTDKYPNRGASRNLPPGSGHRVTFYPKPVDAAEVPRELTGLRTLFTSFHHFAPEQARAVVQNAVDANQGVAIFEATRRVLSTIVLMLPWVLLLSIVAPWTRPFRWTRLFWTYFLPILPLVLLFDGIVSCLRTYGPKELQVMVDALSAPGYNWYVGIRPAGLFRAPITYLIGHPRSGPDLP